MSGIQFNTKSTFKMSTKTITIDSHRQGLTRAKLSLYTSFDYQKSRPIETNRSTITDHGSFDFFHYLFFSCFSHRYVSVRFVPSVSATNKVRSCEFLSWLPRFFIFFASLLQYLATLRSPEINCHSFFTGYLFSTKYSWVG